MDVSDSQYTSIFKLEQLEYTACYCEENIYLLCQQFQEQQKNNDLAKINPNIEQNQGYAIFLTNEEKQCFIKYQQIGNVLDDFLVVWDYHVIFIHRTKDKAKQIRSYVYDFDSVLQWPSPFEDYFSKVINYKGQPKTTQCRIISCDQYTSNFASDRSHMMRKYKQKIIYNSPPPQYPSIINKEGEQMNLDKYWDCAQTDNKYGMKFLPETEMNKFFT